MRARRIRDCAAASGAPVIQAGNAGFDIAEILKAIYPGVADRSQAKIFISREGEAVENYDIQVPPLPPELEVRGVVTWSDGRPAPTARVGYEMFK